MTVEYRTGNIFLPGIVFKRRILPSNSEEVLMRGGMTQKIIVESPDVVRLVSVIHGEILSSKRFSKNGINEAHLESINGTLGGIKRIRWVPTKE